MPVNFIPIDWPALLLYIGAAIAGGLGMYLGIGAVFELAYYRRRPEADAWKCQPHRWPSPRARRREILLGTANMTGASIASGCFIYYVAKGGHHTIYFSVAERGVAFTIVTGLAYFLLTDFLLYWAHRSLHHPGLFRAIHRVHHRFVSPTAFTSAAMHPLEFALYQSIMLLPLFVLPVHVYPLVGTLVYSNYFALVDHSGVKTYSWVPWQPPTQFHDDHHAHFHVNYGQNSALWDRLFGTLRREGRRYGEDVFGGKGAPSGAESAGSRPRYWDYGRRATRERDAALTRASSA